MEDDDEDDYYAQPEKLEAKSSKTITTTEIPSEGETTIRNRKEDTTVKIFTQKSSNQKQVTAIVNPDKNVRLVQTQNGRTIKYPPTYETEKDEFETVDSGPSDISISKTTQKIKYKTRYLPSKSSDANSIQSGDEKGKKILQPNSFLSVSNSVSGSIDENIKESGKSTSTYFTKSSTCGQFTFSCNIVYGSEGRSRICRPKQSNQKC